MSDDDAESSDFEILDIPPKHLSGSSGSSGYGARWETPAYNRPVEVIEVDDDDDEDGDTNGRPQVLDDSDEDLEEGEGSTTAFAAGCSTYASLECKAQVDGTQPVHGVDFASRLDRLRVAQAKWSAIKQERKLDPEKKPNEGDQTAKAELKEATVSYAAQGAWKAMMEREAGLEFESQIRHVKARFGDSLVGDDEEIEQAMFNYDIELPRPWSYFQCQKFNRKEAMWNQVSREKIQRECKESNREQSRRDREASKRAKEAEARRRLAEVREARRDMDVVQREGTQARDRRAQGHVARRDAALADPTPTPAPPRQPAPKRKKKKAKKKPKASTSVKTEAATQAAKKDKKKKYYKPQVKTEAKAVVKTEPKVHVKKEIQVKAEPA